MLPWTLAHGHGYIDRAGAADHRDGHGFADPVPAQSGDQRFGIVHRLAGEADDHVADQQAAVFRGAVGRDMADEQARCLCPAAALPLGQRDRQRADAEELLTRLRGNRVGTSVPITVIRGANAVDVTVTVSERPRKG